MPNSAMVGSLLDWQNAILLRLAALDSVTTREWVGGEAGFEAHVLGRLAKLDSVAAVTCGEDAFQRSVLKRLTAIEG